MLIAHLSDLHVGGPRHDTRLLRAALAEVEDARPDLVVVTGDLTDDGYADQLAEVAAALERLSCQNVVLVPGNHDARNVGYLRFEDAFGPRDTALSLQLEGGTVALVAVDSSKPDIDEGEVGRE